MLSLSLLVMLVVMMTIDPSSADTLTVSVISGQSAVLPSGLKSQRMAKTRDVRWTHANLLLNNRTTKCHHGRCQLLQDGSLSFSKVQEEDSGIYMLEIYDQQGTMKERKVFHLQVQVTSQSPSSQQPVTKQVPPSYQAVPTHSPSTGITRERIAIVVVILLLLLLCITFFFLRKMMHQSSRTSDSTEETHIYMAMHGNRGDRAKQEEDKKQEEPLYVPCHPTAPPELAENIYV
ncbi:uncharacterized protein LOC119785610 [Cyprinodon tularosa]|uniref:uncharacterized protein LOC119785610 n=1 Tax=Cyprinodon tularosa TaxID=77115 RepID=UPI0018E1EB29|nr:uncharacterized protein LOC119785610 [Cyprinodon tularosa]